MKFLLRQASGDIDLCKKHATETRDGWDWGYDEETKHYIADVNDLKTLLKFGRVVVEEWDDSLHLDRDPALLADIKQQITFYDYYLE